MQNKEKKYGFLHNTMLGMTYEEIEESVKNNELVLIPVGVVEEHGPHLPLGTDIYVSMAQAESVVENLHSMNASAIIAPPFYFGGIRAMTRQFPGTFTSSSETIIAEMLDYLKSLDGFGYQRCVMLNNHGDYLHREALIEAIKIANKELSLRTYWLEFMEDMEDHGFKKEDDFLALIQPFDFERFVTLHSEITDECDWHAGAFETAMMMELYPDEVHRDKMVNLPATNLTDEQIPKWIDGEKENIGVIPRGYCGDPMKANHMQTHCDDMYMHTAIGIKDFFAL